MDTAPNQFIPASQSNPKPMPDTEVVVPLFNGLRHISRVEMKQVDAAARQTQEKVQSLLDQFAGQVKQATKAAIAATPVAAIDLEHRDIFIAGLSHRVSQAIHNTGRTVAEQVQMEIQQELLTVLDSLYALAVTVDQMTQYLELQQRWQKAGPFSGSQLNPLEVKAEGLMVTALNKLWSEYNKAALAYTDSGNISHTNTAFGAGVLIGALGLPAISVALSAIDASMIFPNEPSLEGEAGSNQAAQFKAVYQQVILTEIEKELKARRLETTYKVEAHILNSFENLKREIDALLDQAQHRLNEYSDTQPEGYKNAS